MRGNILQTLFFAEDLMVGKGLVNRVDNGFFRMKIGFGDQVNGLALPMNLKAFLGVVQ